MDLDFVLRGIDGRVSVALTRNDEPELVGSGADSAGFPMCSATVDYPAQGYNALLGWVQLVRSDDNHSHGSEFEIDPLSFLGEVPHPFCWLGICPRLFDAPSRASRSDLDWAAQSFLCFPEDDPRGGTEVRALLGFSWGFRIRNEEIELVAPSPLGEAAWDEHGRSLAATYPTWTFAQGFRDR